MDQRSIKFRVWQPKVKRFKIIPKELVGNRCAHFCMSTEQDKFCSFILKSNDSIIIQQYIGFNDNEGNPLFEGDYIKFNENEIGGYKGVGEIIYSTDMCLYGPCYCVIVLDPKHKDTNLGAMRFPFDAKVIGNIFETKFEEIDFS